MNKSQAIRLLAISAFTVSAIGSAAWAATDKPIAHISKEPTAHISKDYAITQIEGDNYTQVTSVTRVATGWTANAMESGKPVALIVNDMGIVDKQ